jgi:hypothetical protein
LFIPLFVIPQQSGGICCYLALAVTKGAQGFSPPKKPSAKPISALPKAGAKPERAKRPDSSPWLLPLSLLPLLFSCHPSPQAEDLLLFLPSLFPSPQKPVKPSKMTSSTKQKK